MGLQEALKNLWENDFVQKNPTKAYKVTYANEYAAVAAYLAGGAEPDWSGFSKLGKGLCETEKHRRSEVATPPPPSGNYINKITDLAAVFLPQGQSSAQIKQGVTNPPGLGGGIWEINDADGSGFRMVATPQMPSNWEAAKKVCLAQLLVRKQVGLYEEWKFKYRYPIADNPAWPPLFHAGTIFEFGHHAPYSTSTGNSGVFIGLDARSGGLGHFIGVPTSTFSDGSGNDFDYYTICTTAQLVKGKDYLCEARFRYNPDATGYCRIKIDGVTLIDQNRPMRPPTSDIPKCQPGWYSNLGTTKNGVELRNIEYKYGV